MPKTYTYTLNVRQPDDLTKIIGAGTFKNLDECVKYLGTLNIKVCQRTLHSILSGYISKRGKYNHINITQTENAVINPGTVKSKELISKPTLPKIVINLKPTNGTKLISQQI
jgi:hypothetical protein